MKLKSAPKRLFTLQLYKRQMEDVVRAMFMSAAPVDRERRVSEYMQVWREEYLPTVTNTAHVHQAPPIAVADLELVKPTLDVEVKMASWLEVDVDQFDRKTLSKRYSLVQVTMESFRGQHLLDAWVTPTKLWGAQTKLSPPFPPFPPQLIQPASKMPFMIVDDVMDASSLVAKDFAAALKNEFPTLTYKTAKNRVTMKPALKINKASSAQAFFDYVSKAQGAHLARKST